MRISYVVPAHDEERVIENTTRQIVNWLLPDHHGSQAILVENGSTDATEEIIGRLALELSDDAVEVVAARSPKGFGNAYREGLSHAKGELVVFTAADLPFGFSDLDAYLDTRPHPPVAIGSKAHPASTIEIGMLRRVMSWAFGLLRRALLGMRVKDSQGTILMEGDIARGMLPRLTSEDYLISTEMIALAIQKGISVMELPVVYVELRQDSKVQPVRDGMNMLRGLLRLRRRLRSSG